MPAKKSSKPKSAETPQPPAKADAKPARKAARKSSGDAKGRGSAAPTPPPPEAGAGPKGESAAEKKASATELLKRQKHNTPAIFKLPTRRSAPVVFTLEDVREALQKRHPEAEAAAAASPETPGQRRGEATAAANPSAPSAQPAQKSRHEAASLADILGVRVEVAAADKPSALARGPVPKKWEKYYQMLVSLRDEVRQDLTEHSSDTLKRSQKEDTGDISTSADAGSDNFDRDFALSLLSTEQEALKEIEAAIDRIHSGSYGTCEITGKPISPERLEAVPFTRFSLEGQRQYEATNRRRAQRAGAFINDADDGVAFADDGDDS